ncbi:MAG: M28 family peptidase [Pseudomonadota bacterium]
MRAAALGLALAGCVTLRLPGQSFQGEPPPPPPELVEALRRDVEQLAGSIGPRSFQRPAALVEAREYLEARLTAAGLPPQRERYTIADPRTREQTFTNIYAEIPGTARPEEVVLVGAHYDTAAYPLGWCDEGSGPTAGADDNTSGVAALLALAERLTPADRTIRLVAFVNEEPPWFQTEDMGSLVHARALAEAGVPVTAMLALDSLGLYSEEPGSQRYPFPLNLAYPDRANFIAFVSDRSSRDLLARVGATFRAGAAVPSEGGALPADLPGVGWSDHWSFWRMGYPAVMVTDTALFRSHVARGGDGEVRMTRTYHCASDRPENLDYATLALVVQGLEAVVRDLATIEP